MPALGTRRGAIAARRRSGAAGPDTGIYVGARIDGGYQNSAWGASTSQDAPWSATDPSPNSWDTFETHVGKPLTFIQWGGSVGAWPPMNYDTAAADRARGRGVFSQYDWGTTVAGCTDLLNNTTTARTNLGTLATQIKNHGHPILFRPLWEMNGTWFSWGRTTFTSTQYVTMWRNLWQIFADVMGGFTAGSGQGTDTGNASFFWCPNDTRAQPDPSPWYPGSAYVDWLGFDGYMFGNDTYKSPATIFDGVYDICAALDGSKPFCLGEFGASVPTSGGTKETWYADLFDTWLPAHPRVKAINYFNEGSTTPGAQYYNVFIETPEAARAVWANRIANAKFKANIVNSVTFPSGQKVPIPAAEGGGGGGPTYVARDTFNRTVVDGWGTADTGGAWTLSSAAPHDITPLVATQTGSASPQDLTARLASVAVVEQNALVKVSVNQVPTGTYSLHVLARATSGNQTYRARVSIATGGVLKAHVQKVVGGSVSDLTTETTWSGGTYVANDLIWIRFQVTNSGTTTVRMKVWRDGTSEPASWFATTTDTESVLQSAAGVGLYARVGSSTTPITPVFSWRDFSVV